MNNPNHISESLETIFFGLKYLKFSDGDPIRDGKKFGSGMEKIWIRDGINLDSGMEKIWIRDGKNLDPGWKKFGSGINIPNPQHCELATLIFDVVVLCDDGGGAGACGGHAHLGAGLPLHRLLQRTQDPRQPPPAHDAHAQTPPRSQLVHPVGPQRRIN
jgi:hypothetical protein